MADQNNAPENEPVDDAKIPKVTGIGGIFFFLKILKKPMNGTPNTLV
jgi:hypothetical protein